MQSVKKENFEFKSALLLLKFTLCEFLLLGVKKLN